MLKNYFILVLTPLIFISCSASDEDSPSVTTNSDGVEKNISESGDSDTIPNIDDDNETNSGETDIDSDKLDAGSGEIIMVTGKIYTVRSGDTLFEVDSARVKISKNSDESYFEATLLSGRAKIIKGD